jgi:hypothetical protein
VFANYTQDVTEGGLVFTNKETISKQRSVLKHIIRTIGANLLQGRSILNVSLPVYIFQPISLLHKLMDTFGFAPVFLERAGLATGIERFNLVVAFAVATLHIPIEQMKPFNPILGETLQGQLKHCQVYAEQTSHHPPISHFQVIGEHFLLQGYHEYQASTSANSIKARQVGVTQVEFSDHSILISFPFVSLGGTLIGSRTFNWRGVITVIDQHNRLLAELQLNPDEGGFFKMFSQPKTPADYFKGSVVRVQPTHPIMTAEGIKAILHNGKSKLKVNDSEVLETVCECEGSWLSHLDIANQPYWRIQDYQRATFLSQASLLPSDSSFRSDLVSLARGDEQGAQAEKDRLEDLQRRDRRLRGERS